MDVLSSFDGRQDQHGARLLHQGLRGKNLRQREDRQIQEQEELEGSMDG